MGKRGNEVRRLDPDGEELPDAWRMTALKCMLVGRIREHVEITAGRYLKYDEMRKEVMKYAMQIRLEKHRGRNGDSMDLGEVDRSTP